MRLYLSSYRIGNHAERLLQMAGDNKRTAVIANACDSVLPEKRAELLSREIADLKELGFEPEEIDLRNYAEGSFSQDHLSGYGTVWVRGGNVFNLRRIMRASGFDAVITKLLQADAIAYGGYSAGVCVLAPTLRGIELCDPVDDIPNGYDAEIVWDGLGVIEYEIAPHYRSDHPESPMIEQVVEYLQEQDIPYQALRDGEVIVVDGNGTEKLS